MNKYYRGIFAGILFSLCLFSKGLPQSESAQFIFDWSDKDQIPTSANAVFQEPSHAFWEVAINCGDLSEEGGAGKTKTTTLNLAHTGQFRFKGTQSIELYTDAGKFERCNQNYTSERVELISDLQKIPGFTLGSESPSQVGTTLWMGWSEMYSEMDESHWTTFLQFFKGRYGNSRSSSIGFRPGVGVYLGVGGNFHALIPEDQLKENVWYDWIVEFRYGYQEVGPGAGMINIWVYEEGDPQTYSFSNEPILSYIGRTIPPESGLSFETEKTLGELKPELRMGIYRWHSGDKKPEEIAEPDHKLVKYLSTTRLKTGTNLGERGFNAVKPRNPNSSNSLTGNLDPSKAFPQIRLQPNPLKEISTLSITHFENASASLQLLDLTGRLVRERSLYLSTETTLIPIKKGDLAPGNYTLQLLVGEVSKTLRFVIE
ncbi:MAG: T9SS type A sorting domain-containing protein [Bacteroidota bacterium]